MITSGWCLDEVRLHSMHLEEKQVDIPLYFFFCSASVNVAGVCSRCVLDFFLCSFVCFLHREHKTDSYLI